VDGIQVPLGAEKMEEKKTTRMAGAAQAIFWGAVGIGCAASQVIRFQDKNMGLYLCICRTHR